MRIIIMSAVNAVSLFCFWKLYSCNDLVTKDFSAVAIKRTAHNRKHKELNGGTNQVFPIFLMGARICVWLLANPSSTEHTETLGRGMGWARFSTKGVQYINPGKKKSNWNNYILSVFLISHTLALTIQGNWNIHVLSIN